MKNATNYNFAVENINRLAPTTRYQGSKRRILPWIYETLRGLKFDTVLDGFGGTASVSYLFKLMDKEVTFNDILLSNYQTGIALIENDTTKLSANDLKYLFQENGFDYSMIIQKAFKDKYYLDEENRCLDTVIHNIYMLSEKYENDVLRKKQAIAFHVLFQACLAKRPYNLFHRSNLYMRLADVKRSFYNKKMWDTPFETLFLRFYNEISDKIFSNKRCNRAICGNILDVQPEKYDLVYLDPPYCRTEKNVPTNYDSLYHFLEGTMDYYNWADKIDYTKINRPLMKRDKSWDKNTIITNFDKIFNIFQDSIIVLSYGEPGYPSIESIKNILYQYKSNIKIKRKEYTYKLNHSNKNGQKLYEVMLIAQ